MKKLRMFWTLGIVAAFANSVCAAQGAQTMKTCLYEGTELVDKGTVPVSCTVVQKTNASTCSLYCNNGDLIYGITDCQPGFFAMYPFNVSFDLYQNCVDLQGACMSPDSVGSGADWDGTDCRCRDLRKEWNPDTKRCEETDDYIACRKTARWDKIGMCVCDTPGFQWDKIQHKCVPLPSQTKCESYNKNPDFKGKVKWVVGKNVCECIEDETGVVISNPDEWWIGTAGCEKKPDVQRRESFAKNKPAADKVGREIDEIVAKLKSISGDWGRSRWKNAEGGFNTARLASDSIAGVVLGTVGGVVTSNIIKKNQVKGGFEDINCSIGGQRVADYADQFRVGIQ